MSLSTPSSELKHRNIPVAGADRFLLTQHIATQDLMIWGISSPAMDDLALATVCDPPSLTWENKILEDLCHGREGSLWGH